MITKLRLERFKSFKDAELTLGPLTTLVGTHASGKSNVRDALRFLHGVGRGYTIADVLGERYAGGALQWSGIRGGLREVAYDGADCFSLEATFRPFGHEPDPAAFGIEVITGNGSAVPRVAYEFLRLANGDTLYEVERQTGVRGKDDARSLWIQLGRELDPPVDGAGGRWRASLELASQQPAISQLANARKLYNAVFRQAGTKQPTVTRTDYPVELYERLASSFATNALESVRFLELAPEAMREPSVPGQTELGDRGENLSSVLQAICDDESQKTGLLQWVQELTPMDVVDFDFPAGPDGKVLLTLIETSGRRTSAHSASDGTLRFLAYLAAFLGPKPARLCVVEEIENGIHPNRLHLLLQLIEQVVNEGEIQVVVTTHSPLVLTLLGRASLEFASVTYRLPEHPETRIKRIVDIPDAPDVLSRRDAGHLHETGWFEQTLYFTEDDPDETPKLDPAPQASAA